MTTLNSMRYLLKGSLGWSIILLVFLSRAAGANPEPEDGKSVWQQALPGFEYQFPRDDSVHPDFKTEWWYFTGNVRDERGHAYGYELTFFRQGVLTPQARAELTTDGQTLSPLVQNDFKFAHFAISDLNGGKFYFVQKISRGAFGEAGFGTPGETPSAGAGKQGIEPLAWIEDWSLQPQPDGSWKIAARAAGETPMSIDLRVMPQKGPVIEGTDGVSQKAAGLGNASHYYSFTRLQTSGTLSLGKDSNAHQVRGESWFDHEWASNQMADDQVGWDWFCFQFDDGTDMMLYAMRRKDGSVDPVSSGTWVNADGTKEHLRREDFRLQPVRSWKSSKTGATYPLGWRVSLPGRQMEFSITPRLDDQELVVPPVSYWEGAIIVAGKKGGHEIKGEGYMELTGYAAAMQALQGDGSTAQNDVTPPPR